MFALFFRTLRFFLRLFLWPLSALARKRGVPKGAFVALEIDGPVVDIAPRRRFWQWQPRGKPLSLPELGEVVRHVNADPRVRGMLVTIKSLGAGMATATSLRALLARVRASGKELVVHLPIGGDTKELYVASCASKIYVGPQATLAPLGFATSVRYVKGALAKAGLVPQIVARGEYKSAGEQLVRENMSEAQREQLEAIHEVFYAQLLLAIGEGRKVDRDRAKAIIDGAPYRAERAVEVGLVDGAAYEDEIPEKLGRPRTISAARFIRLFRSARLPPIFARPVVGVIPVHGTITTSGPLMVGAGARDEALIAQIRAARVNRRVRSVVLHVDSPGGSSLASDRVHHELEQ